MQASTACVAMQAGPSLSSAGQSSNHRHTTAGCWHDLAPPHFSLHLLTQHAHWSPETSKPASHVRPRPRSCTSRTHQTSDTQQQLPQPAQGHASSCERQGGTGTCLAMATGPETTTRPAAASGICVPAKRTTALLIVASRFSLRTCVHSPNASCTLLGRGMRPACMASSVQPVCLVGPVQDAIVGEQPWDRAKLVCRRKGPAFRLSPSP